MRFSARTLVGLFSVLLIIVIVPLLWFKLSQPHQQDIRVTTSISHIDSTIATIPASTIPASNSVSSLSAPAANTEVPERAAPTPAASLPTTGLIIPVLGVAAGQLVDTYTEARSNGRIHDAIDIIAPHNSTVVAAAAGRVVRLFQSKLGGTTVYELSPDGHTVYYYAHLDHYAEGLTEGEQVQQGQVLGYVGDTGDAGPGNYHLHFAIWLIQDPKKFWDGETINPYPILRQVK